MAFNRLNISKVAFNRLNISKVAFNRLNISKIQSFLSLAIVLWRYAIWLDLQDPGGGHKAYVGSCQTFSSALAVQRSKDLAPETTLLHFVAGY